MFESFPNVTTTLKIYITFPKHKQKEIFLKLSIIKRKFGSTRLEERLNYQLILSVNNDITELLTRERAIKESAAKNTGRQAHPGGSPTQETRMLRARVVALCPQNRRNHPGLDTEPPVALPDPAPDLTEHMGTRPGL